MFPVIAHHRFVHFREACAEPERCSRDDELQIYIDESLLNCFQSKFSSFDSRYAMLITILSALNSSKAFAVQAACSFSLVVAALF